MAKGMVFDLGGEVSSFGFSKVDREKLYGKKERVVVDESGITCSSAYRLGDGATVVPPGGTSSLYVDSQFDTVERSALMTVDADGQELPLIPSTLGLPVPIQPADARRVLDHLVTGVYQLQPEALGPRLQETLESGHILESRFNYRDGHDDSAVFLLKNEQGLFALIADRTDFEFLQRDAPVIEAAADDETLGDELDFSMM